MYSVHVVIIIYIIQYAARKGEKKSKRVDFVFEENTHSFLKRWPRVDTRMLCTLEFDAIEITFANLWQKRIRKLE